MRFVPDKRYFVQGAGGSLFSLSPLPPSLPPADQLLDMIAPRRTISVKPFDSKEVCTFVNNLHSYGFSSSDMVELDGVSQV